MKNNFNVVNKILWTLILTQELLSGADGYGDCLQSEKKDNKIRIGFLSRYKSSKVSEGSSFRYHLIDEELLYQY